MNAYRLQWKKQPPGLIDATVLRPDHLALLSMNELAASILRCGRRTYALGEVFSIELQADQRGPALRIPGSDRYRALAAGMTCGTLEVDGHAGDAVGCGMEGGTLHVHGSAGNSAGMAMVGGQLIVDGNVGDRAGGPRPGELRGMTGGELIIHGKTGAYTGTRQRGGLIAVANTVGECPGYRMLAGTLLVCQGDLHAPGVGMGRGTIIGLNATPRPLPTFRGDGHVEPVMLRLLWRRLTQIDFPLPDGLSNSCFLSFSGDMLSVNRGELLYRLRD